ncbi:MAG: bifunctional hydroxymethylpyrimidine kinase/phosphomethylpyrimidine kinase [Deltaproteobacteria bacterium]|nr:bifunctional hydroxymethylpyrimidine kinase/phosphomethylpyrimidine kinase [Deltaproteobacteria bacterium]
MRIQTMTPAALSIAGSDPSGGAGIQADIKTFTVLGVYGGAAITALTSQNTMGVTSFMSLPAAFVKKQVRDVLDDLNVTHIKIGMVGNREIAEVLGEILSGFTGEIIYDPVLKSSSGNFLFAGGCETVIRHIISHSTFLTPNIPELEILTARKCPDADAALTAAQGLFALSPTLKGVCLKGGHLNEGDKIVTDYLVRKSGDRSGTAPSFHIHPARHARITTPNTHGTGCTFASAFTAYHMLTGNAEKAFSNACAFMDILLSNSVTERIGHGTGPLLHHSFRR